MRKAVYAVLIVGFLMVDFLMFHDVFKPGERTTATEYLTGALSLLVFAVAVQGLTRPQR